MTLAAGGQRLCEFWKYIEVCHHLGAICCGWQSADLAETPNWSVTGVPDNVRTGGCLEFPLRGFMEMLVLEVA